MILNFSLYLHYLLMFQALFRVSILHEIQYCMFFQRQKQCILEQKLSIIVMH